MPQTQIRLSRTPEIDKALTYLKTQYRLLSEAEIIKLALSKIYKKEIEENKQTEQKLREAYKNAMEEGHKIGDKLLAKKGLKRENMSEQEIYDTFLDTHHHNS
jgi:flagellar biosynthesis/type III secretory pathway protein FliH